AGTRRRPPEQIRVLAFQSPAEGVLAMINNQVASADGRRGRPMVLYDGDTVVTTAYFESGGRRYPLAALSTVRRAELARRPKSRQYELWARIGGDWVRLYASRTERVYGQVCRA